MSDYENHRGKLKPVLPIEGESFSAVCRRVLLEKKIIEAHEIHEDYIELVKSNLYEEYFIFKEKIYEFIDHEEDDDDYHIHLVEKEDGIIEFSSRFYNGGTCLDEMLEDAFEKMEEEKNSK